MTTTTTHDVSGMSAVPTIDIRDTVTLGQLSTEADILVICKAGTRSRHVP